MTHHPAPSLAVVGSLNFDLLTKVASFPSPGETVLAAATSTAPGGKGANQAVAAAQLGIRTSMVGFVGEDDFGLRMLYALSAAGVDTSHVVTKVDQQTGKAFVTVREDGENTIIVAPGANDTPRLAADVFVFDAVLCQLEVPLEVVIEAARQCTGFFALNASPVQPLPSHLIDRADLIIVNENEFEALPELRRSRVLVVTLGSRGAMLMEGGTEVARVAATPTEVVSAVGAGDAFAAGLVSGILLGLNNVDALRAAGRVAAHALSQISAQPRLDQLAKYLEAA